MFLETFTSYEHVLTKPSQKQTAISLASIHEYVSVAIMES